MAFAGAILTNDNGGALAIVLLTFPHMRNAYERGHIRSTVPWIAALILIPLAAYYAGRFFGTRWAAHSGTEN